jgi:hypothetical protein
LAAHLDPVWGPFRNVADARQHLLPFVDRSCDASVGVAWAANGMIYPLRAPHRDGNGIGVVATFEWSPAPPPPPRPPKGTWEKFKAFLDGWMTMVGEANVQQGKSYMAMGRVMDTAIDRMIHSHQDDAAGVAIDVLCVVVAIALLPTGLSEVGLIGFIGGGILLGADGYVYAKEIGGDEEGAEAARKNLEGLRIAATIMTLPDLAFGGAKAIRELQEFRELSVLDRNTAAAAEGLAARTARATRAERYAQIAERANLRSQIRAKQIMASMKLEISPRVAAVGGVGLLIREEISSDESLLNQTMHRLRVHCTGTHR